MKKQTFLQNDQNNYEHTFKKIPDFLFSHPYYNQISNDAKLLYSLLLSRHSLSTKNKGAFTDERGVYIIFTREQMAAHLHCSRQKAARLVSELLLIDLIQEKRMGLSKANRIYLQDVQSIEENNTCVASMVTETPETVRCYPCEHPDVMIQTHQDVTPCNTSKIDYSEIDYSTSSFSVDPLESIHQEQESNIPAIDPMDKEQPKTKHDKENHFEVLEKVKEQIDFDNYVTYATQDTIKLIECILSVMVEVYTSTKATARINREDITIDLARWQFSKIDCTCIDYVLESFDTVTTDIRDLRAYLRTALYRSPDTAELYFQQSTSSYCKR